ncbi:hypothetical protein D3C81_1693400 [compost metagenome]
MAGSDALINQGTKVNPITALRAIRTWIISSVRFRGWGHSLRTLEWLAQKGADESSASSQNPLSLR